MKDIDYLIIGAGLSGSVIARELTDKGYKCVILEDRSEVGGNIRDKEISGINVHLYGPHIFHTNSDEVWDYMKRFCKFNNFINSPIANYKGEIYNLPFNMNTFSKMWGVTTPEEAKRKIEEQRISCENPKSLEEYVLNLVGMDIYEKLIKGYTEKQWGKPCKELDKSIIRRIPLRFTYNNNYFNAKYQGIPVDGYSKTVERLLEGVEVVTGYKCSYSSKEWLERAKSVVLTGAIDEWYGYCFGVLEYRSLKFKTEELKEENHQGNAVVNYTDARVPWTRIIEHKHFAGVKTLTTIITKEYPQKWEIGKERYYPIENEKNKALYHKYKELADRDGLITVGRLAEYKYYDMDDTIKSALKVVKELCEKQ
nr:MAG TPA: UDP-galactopyranose mutase [Bacteriophage sp.]DAU66801.1 MAG TPA: UDP-galactopyranose mutase [Caudoviricetes sp.]